MEKHLNLFYSYNQGNLSNSERIKQLEDNLTRALIVTVKGLEISNQIKFARRLLKKDFIASTSFVFDLQNTNNYDRKSISERFIIVLQRSESNFISSDFTNLRASFLDSKTELQKAEIIKNIKKHLSSEEESDFFIKNTPIKFSELNSILQMIYGNRADAWIIGDKETLLFETKIGNNVVSKYQIYRHITGKNGFNLKPNEIDSKVSIINITWEEISSILLNLKDTASEREGFLISSLIEYISMTGQRLNLNYIIGGEIDTEIHREQFSLFLSSLDAKLKEKNLPFERKNRNKTELWEVYGIRDEEDEIPQDPHYTVAFWEDRITVYLTSKSKKQINFNLSNLIENFFNQKSKTSKTLSRYFLKQSQYKLVDNQRGQIQGEKHTPFTFYIQFPEIGNNIKSICNFVVEFARMNIYKQFELGYEVLFFDFSRIRETNQENQIRYLNKQLLENPQAIVDDFANFIEETADLYTEMKKK